MENQYTYFTSELIQFYKTVENKNEFLDIINHNLKQLSILQKELKKSKYLFTKKDESVCYEINNVKFDPFKEHLSIINSLLSRNSKNITVLNIFKNIICNKKIIHHKLRIYYDNIVYMEKIDLTYLLLEIDNKKYKVGDTIDIIYNIRKKVDTYLFYIVKERYQYKSIYTLYKDIKKMIQKNITYQELKRIQKFNKITND